MQGDKAASSVSVASQSRDLDGALDSMVPFSKVSATGYAPSPSRPIQISVSRAPFAILAARVRFQGDVENHTTANQGGFAQFAYDANAGTAAINAIGAYSAFTGGGLVNTKIYIFDFLVVY